MADVFTLRSRVLPPDARVVGFRGSEGLSRLYAFTIHVVIAEAIDLEAAVGERGLLEIHRSDGGPPFFFHGIFAEVSLVHVVDGRSLVRAVLVPKLWWLSQTRHSRMFTDMSVPDVLRATLAAGGITGSDVVFDLAGAYAVESHVCQYAESDFAFVSRWMEHEGIYYFFEHGDDKETLVVTDHRSIHRDLAAKPIRYSAAATGNTWAGEALRTFTSRYRALPKRVAVNDYDYSKPTLTIAGAAPISSKGSGEIRLHGERVFSSARAERIAVVRAEAMLAREVLFHGSGTSRYLRAGYTFTLAEHPRPSFDTSYLAIDVEHEGLYPGTAPEMRKLVGIDIEETYRARVTAIPSTVQFRAEEKTPWPRIRGTERGTVDGAADSEYAQIDGSGRYLVRVGFDESNLAAGQASTWIRMMQPHGGTVEGFHFPLRKGTEVLLTFLGGDPDRPVIASMVPNTVTPSPVTSGNHTRNVIQTGGRNRLEIEDLAGQERITLSTPYASSYIRMGSPNAGHHMIISTTGPTLLDAGQDLDIWAGKRIGGGMTEVITLGVSQTYHAKQNTTIEPGPAYGRYEIIKAGGLIEDITGPVVENITGDLFQTIHGDFTRTVDGAVSQTITQEYDLSVTGAATPTYDSTFLLDVKGPLQQETTSGNIAITAAQGMTWTSNGKPFTIMAPQNVIIDAPNVTVNGNEVRLVGGNWIGDTGTTQQRYGTKFTAGIAKAEFVPVSATGFIIDNKLSLITMSIVAAKVDLHGVKMSTQGIKLETEHIHVKNAGFVLKKALLGLTSFGFRNIG